LVRLCSIDRLFLYIRIMAGATYWIRRFREMTAARYVLLRRWVVVGGKKLRLTENGRRGRVFRTGPDCCTLYRARPDYTISFLYIRAPSDVGFCAEPATLTEQASAEKWD
jgi:hypothetical protein